MTIHEACNTIPGMSGGDTAFIEGMCDRFVLAQEATGLAKGQFARMVGLTNSQFTNISKYRNPSSHASIQKAVEQFGFTADWFLNGSKAGFRDPVLAGRLRDLEARDPTPE